MQPSKLSNIALLTFDLDNTLWPVDEVILAAEKTSFKWLTDNHPELTQRFSLEEIRAIRMQAYKDNPDIRHDLTQLRILSLRSLFKAINYSDEKAQEQAEIGFKVFHEARNKVIFYPHAETSLQHLTQHFTLGALTNGNADLKQIGIDDIFNFHLSSESVGASKPAPDMFNKALELAKVDAAQAIHIGDHPEQDIVAAKQLGFQTIWVNMAKQPWPDEFEPSFDAEISCLSELITAIESL